jgi:hypothetical protein
MPILKREDGVGFVLQPYRETLTIKNTSILRKEVRYLAEQHGQNVRLFKRKGGEYEAVFSPDSGILLGETVWHYFNQPEEFIYCEVLNNNAKEKEVLLVIVREGKVYLDIKLKKDNLSEELASLLSETTTRYDVYIYGNGTLSEVFSHSAIKSLTKLDQALYTELQANPALQLLPLEQALDEHGLGIQKRSSLIAITIVCLVLLGGLWWYAHTKQTPLQVNPFEQYELALQTPDPGQQISALNEGIRKADAIQGWYVGSVSYNGQVAQLPMHSLGGNASDLMTESQALNMTVNFSSQGASIGFPTIIEGRPTPDRIANTQQTIALIIDRMMKILPGKAVQINNTTQNQVFQQTGITISFNNISPEVLQLIGSSMDDLPVTLISVTATKKDGLFSGNLQLNVVGN